MTDMHKHPNGGGMVAYTAHVDPSAYVGPDAKVREFAKVGPDASIEGFAVVTGWSRVFRNARVSGNAAILGEARIEGNAHITDWAVVRDRSCVGGSATVGGRTVVDSRAYVRGDAKLTGPHIYITGYAEVTGGTWDESPLQAMLENYQFTHSAPGMVQVGCQIHSIEHWLHSGLDIAAEEDFPEHLIPEVKALIATVQAREGTAPLRFMATHDGNERAISVDMPNVLDPDRADIWATVRTHAEAQFPSTGDITIHADSAETVSFMRTVAEPTDND